MLAKMFNHPRSIIVFDLETTSADPNKARICQFAMRNHKPDGEIKEYKTLINPTIPIPESSSKIHGITSEMVKDAPTFMTLADNLHKGFSNADFAGYNVRFDLRVMTAEFSRCKITFDWVNCIVLDGLRLWQVIEPRTLSDASVYWNQKQLEGAHDAMNDVVASEEVILSQLRHVREDGQKSLPRTLTEIQNLCWPRNPDAIDSEGKFVFIDGVPCFNFGKFKGKPMRDNIDYIQWMFGKDFSPEIKSICDRALAGKFPVQST